KVSHDFRFAAIFYQRFQHNFCFHKFKSRIKRGSGRMHAVARFETINSISPKRPLKKPARKAPTPMTFSLSTASVACYKIRMSAQSKIGFLGAGKMATALAKGFVNAEMVFPREITAADPFDT